MTDWEKLLTDATERVWKVADSVGRGPDRSRTVGSGAAGDDTLVADRDAERVLVESLSSVRELRMLSEEAGDLGPRSSRYLAVIDPLDGSSNFSRGIPFYCTSVCVVEGPGLGDARYALVRNLVNGDVYYAERGRGAKKNHTRIHSSAATELSDSIAAIDVSKASQETVRELSPLVSRLKRQVHFGANALEICMVAEGRVDAFIDIRGRMRVTDIAGAFLIAREAGAVVSSETGEELDPPLDLTSRVNCVAAANGTLHARLIAELPVFRRRRP
ncbi:MAG: hypothetical protein LYZ66_03270 [Nitrososphaerales archaeon]|nr:hypothetical protein [Nitrososphaerales archaeon]